MSASAARRTFAVIDGNSLMHRAFHAVPPTMNAPDGTPTNAIFGFLNMFLKMIDAFHPDGVVVAFDKGKPRVRMEMLPQYKAQRPPMDPDLRQQFPRVKELLARISVPVLEAEGWEGDDILGTLARAGEAVGCDMLLITGDRDMYQLTTEHVKIVGTKKGLSDVAVMTPETVEDLYHGITPELVPDFYGLKGDSSDNIPGVPGIGPKKASALIAQYGSLDEVIAHADEIKGKMGENLRAHIDDALVSRRVATIQTNAPVEVDFGATSFPAYDAQAISEALGELGIMSMQNRFLALLGDEAGGVPAPAELELPRVITVRGAGDTAAEEAFSELSRALGLFEPCVVEKLKFLSPCAREMWLLRTGGTPPAPEAAAQDLYERDNKLVFELTVSAKAPPAVFADAGEGPVPCECTPAGQERTFDGGIIGERMRVRFFLPLPKKCVFVRFFYGKEGEKLPFSAFSFEKFFPLSSIRGSYCAVGDCLVDFRDGAFRVRRRRFLRHLFAEARFEASLCRRGGRGLFCAALRAFYRVARPFVRGVWLLSDRDDAAGDNGEALFDYLNAHPAKGRKVYFVLDRNSPDYPRLQKKGKVVPCLSVKHLLLYLFAEVSASSQADRGARAFAVPELRDLWTKVRFAFLQHGVTKDDVSAVYGKYAVRPDLFVTCAPRECASVCAGEGYALGDEVVLTGFARHDLLRDESAGRRVITFMPTWRRYCVLGHAADAQTDYFRFYSELLCDERLLGAAKRFGYELQFLGHPFMRETDALLPLPPQVKRPEGEERDYNRIFCESALIVTDYSSAAFDFAYLGKPVVYAQFDAAEFFSTHTYTRGYFDYAADGFGPVCGTAEETAQEIILLMRSGCENPEKYAARAADFFAFRDRDNCERIEAAIRRMLTREKR